MLSATRFVPSIPILVACAMLTPATRAAQPTIVLEMRATPVARLKTPGSDVDYTLTVTNRGDASITADTLVLNDRLPEELAFFNGDIDGSGPLSGNFEFDAGASGLSLSPADLSFSNDGSSYGYAPTSGYDGSVKAIRVAPQGAMAANSSFTIRFRAQIR